MTGRRYGSRASTSSGHTRKPSWCVDAARPWADPVCTGRPSRHGGSASWNMVGPAERERTTGLEPATSGLGSPSDGGTAGSGVPRISLPKPTLARGRGTANALATPWVAPSLRPPCSRSTSAAGPAVVPGRPGTPSDRAGAPPPAIPALVGRWNARPWRRTAATGLRPNPPRVGTGCVRRRSRRPAKPGHRPTARAPGGNSPRTGRRRRRCGSLPP